MSTTSLFTLSLHILDLKSSHMLSAGTKSDVSCDVYVLTAVSVASVWEDLCWIRGAADLVLHFCCLQGKIMGRKFSVEVATRGKTLHTRRPANDFQWDSNLNLAAVGLFPCVGIKALIPPSPSWWSGTAGTPGQMIMSGLCRLQSGSLAGVWGIPAGIAGGHVLFE